MGNRSACQLHGHVTEKCAFPFIPYLVWGRIPFHVLLRLLIPCTGPAFSVCLSFEQKNYALYTTVPAADGSLFPFFLNLAFAIGKQSYIVGDERQ